MESSEGMIAVDDGVHLYFQKLGTGSRTILIPNGFCFLEDFRHLAGGSTVIFYDVRNRGRSDTITDQALLARGIHQDVDDLGAVRRNFGLDQIDLIGHSYIGLMVALYAMKYPAHVRRLVQIGPAQPDASKQYPAHLKGTDLTLAEIASELARMRQEPPSGDAEAMCRKFWSVMQRMFVADPANGARIDWGRCHLPNERNFLRYWVGQLWPSIQNLKLTSQDIAKVTALVLIVHGTRDRNAPYGGARDWAAQLPSARLVTVPDAAHAPWIEAPDLAFKSIKTFLDGAWPDAAEIV